MVYLRLPACSRDQHATGPIREQKLMGRVWQVSGWKGLPVRRGAAGERGWSAERSSMSLFMWSLQLPQPLVG